MHWRRDCFELIYPDVPSLGQFLRFSNDFRWNDSCHDEVLALGNASGLHLAEYLRGTCSNVAKLGCCTAHPIEIDVIDFESDGEDGLQHSGFRTELNLVNDNCSSQNSCPTSPTVRNKESIVTPMHPLPRS